MEYVLIFLLGAFPVAGWVCICKCLRTVTLAEPIGAVVYILWVAAFTFADITTGLFSLGWILVLAAPAIWFVLLLVGLAIEEHVGDAKVAWRFQSFPGYSVRLSEYSDRFMVLKNGVPFEMAGICERWNERKQAKAIAQAIRTMAQTENR